MKDCPSFIINEMKKRENDPMLPTLLDTYIDELNDRILTCVNSSSEIGILLIMLNSLYEAKETLVKLNNKI
jgi:hypothetical protein